MFKFSEKSHDDLIKEWQKNPEFRKAYQALEKEFNPKAQSTDSKINVNKKTRRASEK